MAMASLLVPLASHRDQKILDRGAFKTVVNNMPCLRLDVKSLQSNKPILKKFMLKIRNFKPVVYNGEMAEVFLDPQKLAIETVNEDVKKKLDWDNVFFLSQFELAYENWEAAEVLRAILPPVVEVPKSFSQIGHIVHFNLRDDQLPYKHIIAEVFLDKISNAKTIVNKLSNINNVYRQFEMEVLAGDENTVVEVKENYCIYRFDFAKVYWNPRLGGEHLNLVNLLKPEDVLYDVFAGVGPFAILAGKKKVRVLANDLNAESYNALKGNIKLNKVQDHVEAFNMDGRDFIKTVVKNDILQRKQDKLGGREHIAMNLPASAVEFLDTFFSWLDKEESAKISLQMPIVHVYCFIKAEKQDDFQMMAKNLVENQLNTNLTNDNLLEIKYVRNVAPNKEMLRVSFYLTKEILEVEEPASKKLKLLE